LYQSPFSFLPTHKLVVYANRKPVLKDIGRSMRRRLRLIPFDHAFIRPANEPDLAVQLRAEAPAILAKLISILAAQGDITTEPPPPPCVLDATAAYFDQADPTAPWFNACCRLDPAGVVPCSYLHASYVKFVGGLGHHVTAPLDQKTLIKCLLARPGVTRPNPDLPRKIDDKARRVLLGLRLLTDQEIATNVHESDRDDGNEIPF
jgi:putative DNA primase/helicase